MPSLLLVFAVGAGAGFLGGMLGKGGSAIATPILVAIGVPPMIAVAAPLPATIPGTLLAADRYRRRSLVDGRVLRIALLAGLPATVVGALLTGWVSGGALVLATDALIATLGLRLLLRPSVDPAPGTVVHATDRDRTIAVAVVTGLAGGLLANSGGFLLGPLFIAVLGMRVKPALGTSLAVAAGLAVPGSVVHLALGHLDWPVVAAFGLGSVPLSGLGARVALSVDAHRLERAYGLALLVLGVGFLVAAC